MTDFTRTQITNLALREIGAPRIDDWQESSAQADVARDVWDQARRRSLARHTWKFASKGAELGRSGTAPVTRYDYYYTLPGDYVRLCSISEHQNMEPELIGNEWDLDENGVKTNAETVYVEYIYDAPAIGAWNPWFVDVMAVDLAADMTAPLKSDRDREALLQIAAMKLKEARSLDSTEKNVVSVPESRWLQGMKGQSRIRPESAGSF